MNVLLLKAWLAEEAPALIGSRLRDVQQVDAKSFALELDAGRERPAAWLLVSILEAHPVLALLPGGPDTPVWLLLADKSVRPTKDSNFVKALRFHIKGYELQAVSQDGFDRSVLLEFAQRDTYGRETRKTLRVELAGRAANAYLLSERGMVVSIFKRLTPGRSAVRNIVTGKPLPEPPPLGKYIAAEGGTVKLAIELDAVRAEVGADENVLSELLTRRVAGGDKALWPALESLSPPAIHLWALRSFILRLQCGEFTSQLFGLGPDRSANDAALALWLAQRDNRAPAKQAAMPETIDPDEYRLQQIRAQIELARRADELEQAALELQREAATLPDRDAEAVHLRQWRELHPSWADRIDLAASARDNASELVQYAQRLRRALPRLEALVEATRASPETRLPSPPAGAGPVASTKPSAPLARELKRLGQHDVKYLRFTSGDGLPILCGQTDRSNDELLRLYGSTRHLWLHARNYPGSHVIVLSGGAEVPQRSLEEAAVIAGYFSQGRGERDLEVSYVPVRYLRRPREGKPGQVLLTREKVVRVNPMAFEELRDKLRPGG